MKKALAGSRSRSRQRALAGAAAAFFLFLAASAAWALDPRKEIGHFIIESWSTENSNIAQNSVLSLLQSRDGYIWTGTYEGLCRFDGRNFTVFDKSNTPEIQNNGMLVMAEGGDGALWIGTPNGLLCRRGGKFRNFTAADGLASDFILSLCPDGDGGLWIGTTRGLSRYRDGAFSILQAPAGVELSYVSALSMDLGGSLWIGTSAGLFSYRDGGVTPQALPGGKAGNTVWSLRVARDGTLWIGTAGDALVSLRRGQVRSYSQEEGLSGNRVRVIYEDSRGTLWIGTDNGGLNRLEGDSFTHLQQRHGLSNDSVRALVEDHEGSLWVGTFGGGLNRLKDDRYIFYNTRNGLPVDMTRAILQDREGNFWIGTIGGGLARFGADGFRVFGSAEGLASLRVWSIAQGSDGAIWFGTYGGGLHRLQDGKVKVWSTRNGLSNDIVRAVLAARDGSIWAGTNGGGIDVLRADGRIVNYSRRNGLGDDFIYAITQDRQGSVWVGTYNGELYRFRNEEITTFHPHGRASKNAIWVIRPEDDGALWIGTNSGGLVRFKNGEFRTIDTRNGLYNDVAFQILEDDHGYFWMNCNKGVFRASKKELNEFADGRITRIRSLSFGISEGVRGVESTGPAQPAGWKSRDGKLWFPTIKGVAVVDPDYRKRNERVPPVLIEKMAVEGEAVDADRPVVIGPGRRKIEFTYTALSYLVPEKNRFRTMLRGFDRDWSIETDQRQVSYTNLPPGSYTFRVIACNNDGEWNREGASLGFVLRPYFFQTTWFWALVALGALAMAVLAFRLRFRRLQRRGRELETVVRERTRELSRVNEELLQANRVQEELRRIAVHDLKNPLQAIMGTAELIQRQNRELPGAAMLAEKISLASKRMLGLINKMLEISRFERGDLKLELQLVDVGELIQLAAGGFAEQLQQKGQTLDLALEPRCRVSGDLEWLKEIFDNLISNAIKFSPLQAVIAVSSRCLENKVLVAVRDQGPGLTPEDKARLFGKFQRLSAKPTGGESSTGLGLSIVEQLVSRHGGRIWAEGEPGQGSTFFVEFPKA
ncbi:MAG: ATP-binding protein [Acidobacteria bacterium]|jgi:signal transduction histidine kinase/ligand-binding sensor domain-containing protein|nr:ATP-binding protein [Acidobacteriota bacterium]